jgi:hypothetical protein
MADSRLPPPAPASAHQRWCHRSALRWWSRLSTAWFARHAGMSAVAPGWAALWWCADAPTTLACGLVPSVWQQCGFPARFLASLECRRALAPPVIGHDVEPFPICWSLSSLCHASLFLRGYWIGGCPALLHGTDNALFECSLCSDFTPKHYGIASLRREPQPSR